LLGWFFRLDSVAPDEMPAAAQIKYASERGSLGFNATNYCDMRLAVIRKNLQYMVYIVSMIKSLLCYILHVN